MDDLDRTPDSEDLREALDVRAVAYELEKQGENPATLHAQADAMFLRIARYLVARNLPGVELPSTPVRAWGSYVCGGPELTNRYLSEHLVWLYGCENDAQGMRSSAIDGTVMWLGVVSDPLPVRTHQSATGP